MRLADASPLIFTLVYFEVEVMRMRLAALVTAKSVTTDAALVASKLSVPFRMLSALKANPVTPTAPAKTELTFTLMFSNPTITGTAVISSTVLNVNASVSVVDVSTMTSSEP